jgi:hypothetical protein
VASVYCTNCPQYYNLQECRSFVGWRRRCCDHLLQASSLIHTNDQHGADAKQHSSKYSEHNVEPRDRARLTRVVPLANTMPIVMDALVAFAMSAIWTRRAGLTIVARLACTTIVIDKVLVACTDCLTGRVITSPIVRAHIIHGAITPSYKQRERESERARESARACVCQSRITPLMHPTCNIPQYWKVTLVVLRAGPFDTKNGIGSPGSAGGTTQVM